MNHIFLVFFLLLCCTVKAQQTPEIMLNSDINVKSSCDTQKPDLSGSQIKEIICYDEKAEITIIAKSNTEIVAYWIVGDPCLEETDHTLDNKFSDLDGGCTYTLYAKDSNGCVGEKTVFIDQPEQMGFSSIDLVHPVGNKLGSITVVVTGGWGGYTIALTRIVSGVPIEIEELSNQSADEKITFAGLVAGMYRIAILSDEKGCNTNEFIVEVLEQIITGETDFEAAKIKIFPNPSSDGRFIIEWNSSEDRKITLELYNTNGQLIYKTSAQTGVDGGHTALDLSSQSRGAYLLFVPELNIRQRLVIQ